MVLVMAVIPFFWGIDQSWAQQVPAPSPQNQQNMTNFEKLQEELAARRAAQGKMRGTTPAQRKAAAKRLKAKIGTQQNKSAPASGGEVSK